MNLLPSFLSIIVLIGTIYKIKLVLLIVLFEPVIMNVLFVLDKNDVLSHKDMVNFQSVFWVVVMIFIYHFYDVKKYFNDK
ncbi:hypothetical protein AB2S62_22160 [Vibrio sp. NTOU-M3]|uniref:hypothetical protein n=1 Tax=Vibrio sp. NTOU-M3 TaxID=3234954 RepID=UPI0035A83507